MLPYTAKVSLITTLKAKKFPPKVETNKICPFLLQLILLILPAFFGTSIFSEVSSSKVFLSIILIQFSPAIAILFTHY